ncbi:MAG: tail fiber protein [Nitrospira sp.]|nr:tail fiber protein [Nitrospira sp.]MDH4327375.1 tail fiber protein [Nitrospira sp.]MDH5252072.1 tail fiber protein [Nitrospira sp.]
MSTLAQRVQLGPFFDMGQICGAALLEHYEPGSSTPKTIWSDQAKALDLANPFVSDANGIFDFFADGYYKIIIKKSDGQVLKTLDNWKWIDVESPTLSLGDAVPTASSMSIGASTWAHWTGSVNVQGLIGTALFYWAVADGNFSLIHSSSLILPDARNRKVLSGDVLLFLNEGANTWRLSTHMQKEGGWTGRQGGTVGASATLAIPTDGDFLDVSGGTTITAVATAQAGYRFRARFIGTGLNLTHNATSLIAPWACDYRTVQNEILEFMSLGAGNWIFFSINGPNEQTGQDIYWNGTSAPLGGLPEDGSAVSRSTYSGLFQKIGTTYGVGDGSTTFNVPDDRGRVTLMVDGAANRITSASTNGTNADTLGGVGGAETHTLTTPEIPAHTHDTDGAGSTGGSAGFTFSTTISGTRTSNSTGGGGAHSNTQPWIAKHKYIRF